MAQIEDPMAPGDLAVVPALFEHSVAVYREMEANARRMPDYNDLLVYEGHLTGLFKKLRLSVPYYTLIKNHLTEMGCIEQLRRGGGTAESRWVLWKEPKLDEWRENPSRPRRGNKTSMHDQQIRTLAARVEQLETQVAGLVKTIHILLPGAGN